MNIPSIIRCMVISFLSGTAMILSDCQGYEVPPPPKELSTLSGEPAGPNCPSGGIRLDYGLDVNRDSILEAEEIQMTKFICNGSIPDVAYDTLVNTTDVPVGNECLRGGIMVSLGYDVNRDGSLSAEETQFTNIQCNETDAEHQVKYQLLELKPITTYSTNNKINYKYEIGFNKLDYLGYSAAFIRVLCASSDLSVPVETDLFNLTDNILVPTSTATGNSTTPGWFDSSNFLTLLPDKPIDMVLRVRSGKEGVKVAVYQAYLIVYRLQ